MKISLIVPFKNEKEYATKTLSIITQYMKKHKQACEIIAVDDSTDGTFELLKGYAKKHNNINVIKGGDPPGYGKAIRRGFSHATGDVLIPFNGDLCDSLDDVMRYVEHIKKGYDMVFGSRYMTGGEFIDYPSHKIIFSKLGNYFLMFLFRVRCSDITNTFKAYRREVIETIKPRANSYEIGLETALRGVRHGFRYTTIPISWTGRQYGVSKMRLGLSVLKHYKMSMRILLRL